MLALTVYYVRTIQQYSNTTIPYTVLYCKLYHTVLLLTSPYDTIQPDPTVHRLLSPIAPTRPDNATMSESQQLLHGNPDDFDSDCDSDTHLDVARRSRPSPSPASSRPSSTSPAPSGAGAGAGTNGFPKPKRVSSFAQQRPDGTPRTPNRVRFEDDPVRRSVNADRGGEWLELDGEDYMDDGRPGRERVQRLPLLTGIEAPSVALAEEFVPEDHLESARPRSGMRSAFMNMANSIM